MLPTTLHKGGMKRHTLCYLTLQTHSPLQFTNTYWEEWKKLPFFTTARKLCAGMKETVLC